MLNLGRHGHHPPGRQRELSIAAGNVGHRGRVAYDLIVGSIAGLIRPARPIIREDILRPFRVAVPHGLVPWRGLTAPIGVLQSHAQVIRRDLALALGACGVLAYNWWLLVPLRPGLMRSANELFSNLEVTGQPFATWMQRADLLAGLLMLAAFMAAGSKNVKAGRPDLIAMLVYSAAGAAGGLFPETCADSISRSCRELELSLRLPLAQYLHICAGVVEFGSITVAVAYAVWRTKQQQAPIARMYRRLAIGAIAAYPLLGLAYLTNRFGAIIEGLFFIGFSVMVVAELLERARPPRSPGQAGMPAHSRDDAAALDQ